MNIRIIDVREDTDSEHVVLGHFVAVEVTTGMWWWRKVATRLFYRENKYDWYDLDANEPIFQFGELRKLCDALWDEHEARAQLDVIRERMTKIRERDQAGSNTVRKGPHR